MSRSSSALPVAVSIQCQRVDYTLTRIALVSDRVDRASDSNTYQPSVSTGGKSDRPGFE